MKKIVALFLTALLCAGVLAGTAFATEEEEMVPVYASVPTGWEAPCIWAWADDGTNAFDAWPGEPMEAVGEGNWYFCYVPKFVNNVIINANAGTVQIEGAVIEAGKPVWITIGDDAAATISYDAQTTTEIPAYVEKFTVHAYVPLTWKTVNMWAWSAPDGTNAFPAWPGLQMTEGEDGWFTGKAPVWVNSLIINGNEGTVQTEDVAIEGKELWLTVYEDLTYELSYEDPATAGVPDITVHAKVPADWAAPCTWAWSAPDGTNAYAAWPGEPMTEADGWYTVTAPGWINSVIINANEGSVQTTDISVETGKDLWLVVTDGENVSLTYEEPADEPAAPVEPEPTETPDEPEAPTEPAEPTEPEEPKESNTGLYIGIAAVAVAAIGGGAYYVNKKKKN